MLNNRWFRQRYRFANLMCVFFWTWVNFMYWLIYIKRLSGNCIRKRIVHLFRFVNIIWICVKRRTFRIKWLFIIICQFIFLSIRGLLTKHTKIIIFGIMYIDIIFTLLRAKTSMLCYFPLYPMHLIPDVHHIIFQISYYFILLLMSFYLFCHIFFLFFRYCLKTFYFFLNL